MNSVLGAILGIIALWGSGGFSMLYFQANPGPGANRLRVLFLLMACVLAVVGVALYSDSMLS